MLKERFGKLEGKLLSEIKSYYGERLISVVIFGSVARGAQRPDSDVDLLPESCTKTHLFPIKGNVFIFRP